jgi:ComF family protein
MHCHDGASHYEPDRNLWKINKELEATAKGSNVPEKLVYQLYKSIWGFLDLIYPPQCGGCGVQGARWCANCASNLDWIVPPVCPVCGMSHDREQICNQCQMAPPAWDQLRSVAQYGGNLRTAIHALKYRRDLGMGESLSRHLVELFETLDWKADLIVSVPLDLARMQERGYNQVSLLAIPLALAIGIPYRPRALRKIRQTPRQVTLSAGQRRANMEGAFEAEAEEVREKIVLLMDDVITTGTTLQACSQALRTAGARQIFILTLARAGYPKEMSGQEFVEDS